MLKKVLGALWRGAPRRLRRWGVRLVEPRFTVTAGAVVVDERGRVLLLNHVFRVGTGWGIPGGFMEKGEQPEEAFRRELREEIGLELESAEIAFVRTLKQAAAGRDHLSLPPARRASQSARSFEIKSAEWFAPDALPPELSADQRGLIKRALSDGAKPPD